MNLVTVSHRTTYRYARAVSFGAHELMLRPLAGRDQRVLECIVSASPRATIVCGTDAYGNSVDRAILERADSELSFVSSFKVLHRYRTRERLAELSLACARMPVRHGGARDVETGLFRRREDPKGHVAEWAKSVVSTSSDGGDLAALSGMCARMNSTFRYIGRERAGTQDPSDTLRLGSGSCRDFAFLMAEGARSLGHPARFASGYIYDDEAPFGEVGGLVGRLSTHAWTQVHLPGLGWVDFDPTNDLVGGRNLIVSAVVMEPSEACPIWGSYEGSTTDYVGMEVDVSARCTRVEPNRSTAIEDAMLDSAPVVRI